jgi:putative transposase
MHESPHPSPAEAWARMRFAVIGRLLSAPPPRGELEREIRRLAETAWQHPTTGEPVRFARSTIERWYYHGLHHPKDPVAALKRGVRKDSGRISINPDLAAELRKQYAAYPTWSYLLHAQNLASLVRAKPDLGPMLSYTTIRRYMQAQGMRKKKRPRTKGPEPVKPAWEGREVRSFEAPYVGSLWHLDFHHGSCKVLTPTGEWQTPIALGILDDHSRLACHVQWYFTETAEDLVHGLAQAFQKWGLPRAIMTDNGAAMKAEEFLQGLERLGIIHEPTIPYSPYQNAKEEVFWGPLEGRLVAMLAHVKTLTVDFLNQVTQPWVDLDYNRKHHSELGQSPLDRYVNDADVLRACPSSDALREAFRLQTVRTQRTSDGTVSIEAVRFEIPARFRHLRTLAVRYARWNLGLVHLVDSRSGSVLCRIYPLDKEANADGRRRRLEEGSPEVETDVVPQDELPPLLRELLDRHSRTGKPPGYIPKPSRDGAEQQAQDHEKDQEKTA